MDKLENDGYILVENKSFKKNFHESLLSFYSKNKIDYIQLKKFIDHKFFPVIKKILHINQDQDVYYNKFKFSNIKFSDISTMHCDIYNNTNENIINIYTFSYYFDDAYLEIIPESHRKDYIIKHNSHSSYKNLKKIYIHSGTFVIYNSCIHYRDIGLLNNEQRLLKIYDINFNYDDFKKYSSKITIIRTNDSITLKYISKIINNFFKNNEIKNIIYIHYFFVYYNLQYKISILSSDLSPFEKKNKLISYESGKRINYSHIDNKELNIYIICNKNIQHCGPGYFYFYCTIIYWIILIILFIFVFKKIKN